MTIKVAIVADDLTGALDTGTPFVSAGLSVAVALDVEAVETAIATGAEVVVVNTQSRALDPVRAVERIKQAATALKRTSPAFVFKKIDSRLKGNVAVESEALAAAFGRLEMLVAPAVPDQQRHTSQGHVVGFGIADPLPIMPLFAVCAPDVRVADASTDDDLDGIIEGLDGLTTLAVGARGLGLALARQLALSPSRTPYSTSARTLLAFGSRDPITNSQMAMLLESGLLASHRDAPHGVVSVDNEPPGLPMLLRCSGDLTDRPKEVADRFAAGVSKVVAATSPDILIMGGGDTAYAILHVLGARVLSPKGEIEAGIPWFEAQLPGRGQMRCAVKSGGFGNSQSLIKVLQDEPEVRQLGQCQEWWIE
ncbi:four-carbon acid sugar kinase family protein [Sinorhizobium numidicum]|uniref:Four-carbon acid sugar kinase family protein n=1 Tax=Sinorhizobium numidicum TaxID=680248 RepID=A0ABY8CVJ6_9HYPH|nr:four-carbon acid sugar kinase family protein [Sinorhizobium numidicum]WEX75017.1 four-carbon acid sugar kinase family protein [Sinorhizobium numidicum]WEX81011.1 four-carbon acid sugar kinase family protein [Sinorhizobium numidicum]